MTDTPLLSTQDVVKTFPLPRTILETLGRRRARAVHAVDRVSLTLYPGETLGLIGESGSGKTTFGWLIARLYEATSGGIQFEGEEISDLSGRALRSWRRHVQVVFQDPVGSLDPRLRVWQIVGEPIRVQEELRRRMVRAERRRALRTRPSLPPDATSPSERVGERSIDPPELPPRITREELRSRVRATLPQVGLPEDCLDQYPHEFSGGGRQRISLARALSVEPRLIVLDEPTSALDVSVQAQILNRLVEIQRERGVAYLLITHNVAAVRYVADRVAVMYLGQIVEVGPVREVLDAPIHPYTKALLAALPQNDPSRRRTRYRITGDIPTIIDPKPGCRFAPRCPFAQDRCRGADPPLRSLSNGASHAVACVRVDEVGGLPPSVFLQEGAPPSVTTAASLTPSPDADPS